MKSPAFQFYPDKWQADTRRLSWKAKGFYHELLCVIWMQFQDTCSIPNDDDFIASELGSNKDEWVAAKAEIMHPMRPILEVTETNRLLSRGLLKELDKQEERRERLRINGAKGGRPKTKRKPKNKAGSENLNERLPSPSSSPAPSPSTSISTPLTPQGDLEFEEFWNAYPRKVGKDEAKKAFIKRKCWQIIPEIMAGINRSKSSLEWTRDGGQYVPHPSTWINQGRWSDVPFLNGNHSKPELQTPQAINIVIQAKRQKAMEIKNKFCSDTAIDSVWSDPNKRKEFQQINKEIRELNSKLSQMA